MAKQKEIVKAHDTGDLIFKEDAYVRDVEIKAVDLCLVPDMSIITDEDRKDRTETRYYKNNPKWDRLVEDNGHTTYYKELMVSEEGEPRGYISRISQIDNDCKEIYQRLNKESEIRQLKNRNLWERITRKYE